MPCTVVSGCVCGGLRGGEEGLEGNMGERRGGICIHVLGRRAGLGRVLRGVLHMGQWVCWILTSVCNPAIPPPPCPILNFVALQG